MDVSEQNEHELNEREGGERQDWLSNYLRKCASLSKSADSASPKSWRTRDPIYALLRKRQDLEQFLPPRDQSFSVAVGGGNSNSSTIGAGTINVPQGSDFGITEALHACQSPEKLQIIHRAFDAAAFSVLRALQKQRFLTEAKSREFKGSFMNGTQDDIDSKGKSKTSLPSILQTIDELAQAKMDAMDVVSHKRKTQASAAVDSASSSSAKRVKSDADRKTQKQEKTNKQKVLSSSSPINDVVPAVQLAGYSNLDSRSTVSRAILCAAASLTFKQLTPDFEGREDINILNVPQNPNPEDSTFRKKDDQSSKEGANTAETLCETPPGTVALDDIKNQMKKNKRVDLELEEDEKKPEINMGAVIMSAEIFAKRSIEQARGAVQRSERRRKWRMDCARAELITKKNKLGLCMSKTGTNGSTHFNPLAEYLAWKNLDVIVTDSEDDSDREDAKIMDNDNINAKIDARMGSTFVPETKSEEWTMRCLPRLLDVMHRGPGNVIYHDLKWKSRSDRIIQLLHGLAVDNRFNSFSDDGEDDLGEYSNYGPHLIITTEHDLDKFMGVLQPVDSQCSPCLKGLMYNGNVPQRRKKRMEHFTSIGLSGFSSSPYNVIVTTYRLFFEDYLHFCHIPFQAVILDDGMSWLGTAHFDPNGKLGKVFDMALWSKSDLHSGLAGVLEKKWDFSLDIAPDCAHNAHYRKGVDDEDNMNSKDHSLTSPPTLLGLTARYRVLVASKMHSVYRDTTYPAPAPSLLSFLIPQFADVVKEEWDRSRIHTCEMSMDHVRMLISRGVVVFNGSDLDNEYAANDLFSLAMAAMMGNKLCSIPDKSPSSENPYPQIVSSSGKMLSLSTDKMISNGKIVQSRRLAASWLTNGSPIRYELGTLSLDPMMNIIRQARSKNGYVCEEIIPASTFLSVGSGGAVVGASAFRTALRCGRSFGSEQGLRQHIAAMHAPPGTWLCRSCAIDCGTSQARTQHERSCTANNAGPGYSKEYPSGGGVTTVGQCAKKQNGDKGSAAIVIKDQDGCYRVPGYRGVWVDPKGKHFIKIDGKPFIMHQENDALEGDSYSQRIYYDSSEKAARMHDNIIRRNGMESVSEMNYKSDGSRIKYDKSTTTTAIGRGLEMLGGGASSVVPALSVINIKDLPKGVVPLLRDPRQTSRAGGNSKRYIYAYRGVCRQARKGHDRWQSQISFGGTNHYLGTFDSEWDAAAIYAWAHLILYGEEATKKAQKEGEDAVAAYEQEKKDIAAGKSVSPPPKKKRVASTKTKGSGQRGRKKKSEGGQFSPITMDLIKTAMSNKMTSEFQGSKLSDDDSALLRNVSERILASRSKVKNEFVKCISVGITQNKLFSGCALLVGLSAADAQWSADDFFGSIRNLLGPDKETFLPAMKSECSLSVRFRSLIKGTPCFIGKASMTLEQAVVSLGFYGSELGGTIGRVDCNIGGIGWSCSEASVCISYSSEENIFNFTVCNENDFVTLNGFRIKASTGSVVIRSGDVCNVGSRVFLFLLPFSV